MNKKDKEISQLDLLMEYFMKNPKRDIPHPEIVDWVTKEFLQRTGKVFRDPDRGIRSLHQRGNLIKIAKGIYRYDPSLIQHKTLEDFTEKQKKEILKRDNYRCVICGKGTKDGVELHVDHIKPKELGGKGTTSNGQTLCSQHNFLKKTYKQTETGKKMFIRLFELARESRDEKLVKFCEDILKTFDKHGVNGHIEWSKNKEK